MSNFNDSGRFGEISNQSTVVVNCQHDIDDLKNRMAVDSSTAYIYKGADATVDPATSRIDINDICFTVGDGKSSRRSIMNNAIPVASNCNGLMIHKTKLDPVGKLVQSGCLLKVVNLCHSILIGHGK